MDKSSRTHILTYNHLLRHSDDVSSRGLALSEFIDNSIASHLENSPNKEEIGNIEKCSIDIIADESDPLNIKITIKDNAAGMTESELFRAAQEYHNSSEKNSNHINQYGVGMKLAIFWFGKNGKIWTKRKAHPEFMLDYETNKHNPNDAVVTPVIKSKDNLIDGHGTIILIENVRDSRRLLLDTNDEKTTTNDAFETIRNRFREYISNGLIITFKMITKDNPVEREVLKITPQNIIDANIFLTKSFTLERICGITNVGKMTEQEQALLAEKKEELQKLKQEPKLNTAIYKEKHLFALIENNKPLKIEEKIMLNKKELKVTLCFLSKADSKHSGVGIKHCHRFIHHLPNIPSKKVGAMPFSREIKFCGGISRWMYAEVDLSNTEKYGLKPDKNKASIVWDDEKLKNWYDGFEKIINKYADFIHYFLQRITSKGYRTDPKKLKKQHALNEIYNDLHISKNNDLTVELRENSPICQQYQLVGTTQIKMTKSSSLKDVFSWRELDDNCFELEYNNDNDRIFNPETFTELYFLRLISLIKLISIGKYSTDRDILAVINDILKG